MGAKIDFLTCKTRFLKRRVLKLKFWNFKFFVWFYFFYQQCLDPNAPDVTIHPHIACWTFQKQSLINSTKCEKTASNSKIHMFTGCILKNCLQICIDGVICSEPLSNLGSLSSRQRVANHIKLYSFDVNFRAIDARKLYLERKWRVV